jgi:flagellar hook-associated protein 3 FlgL
MRITSSGSYQSLLSGIQSIEQRLQQDQTEITSGNKINQPSDDPAGSADIVRLTGEKSEIAQYTSNAAAGESRLNFTDTVLSSVQDAVQSVISLGQAALGNTSSASAYTTEINGVRDQLVSAANTNFQGVSIFGGSVTNKPPYVVQADGSVTYQGNSATTQLQVSRNSTLQIGIPGSQVFSGSIDVFSSVKQLSDAITSGDKSAMQTQLTNLQQYFDSVSAARSQVGGLVNQSQSIQSDLQSYELARAGDQSRIQSADLVQATTDFTQTQTALQAAMAVGAKISQVSLLDYIK